MRRRLLGLDLHLEVGAVSDMQLAALPLRHDDQIRSGWPCNEVRDYADHGNEDDKDEPQGFGDTAMVPTPEVVDERPDDDQSPEASPAKTRSVQKMFNSG